ncbi:MAG TPA: SCO family protein [Rhizomicrobium sp.]|nr:SCO family protein [Rhizomicrobium sp.]
MRRISTVLLLCALALAAGLSIFLWRLGDTLTPAGGPAAIGGPFALTDQNGHPFTDRNLRGRWVLLYFGYTYCPDVCPTTLALMEAALTKLGPDAARVVPVFVTIDPARDTPAVMKTYVAQFGPRFIGLTGSPAAIAAIAHSYRVYYARHPLKGGGYSMDHSSVIYLLDPEGRFVKAYDDESGANAIAGDLKNEIASQQG